MNRPLLILASGLIACGAAALIFTRQPPSPARPTAGMPRNADPATLKPGARRSEVLAALQGEFVVDYFVQEGVSPPYHFELYSTADHACVIAVFDYFGSAPSLYESEPSRLHGSPPREDRLVKPLARFSPPMSDGDLRESLTRQFPFLKPDAVDLTAARTMAIFNQQSP